MTRWLLLALALSGCDVVLGLEHVEPVAFKVNGTYRYRTVVNNAVFEPMPVEEILPVEGIGLQAFLDDGTESPLEYRADGSFSFPIDYPGQPYRIRYTSGANTAEWQHSASEIAIGGTPAGRRDARPVAQTTVVLPNYVPLSAVQRAFITSTGVYTQTSTGMMGPTVSFDWRLAAPAAGATTGMLDAVKNDRIYAYEQEATTVGNSPAWSRIRALSQTSITQAPLTTAMLPQLAAVAPNTCMRVIADGAAEKARMMITHPRTYMRDTGSWFAYSVPAPDWVGFSGSLYSASCGYAGPRALDIAPVFHDPYPGTLMANVNTALFFITQLPGTQMSAELANVTRVYRSAERGAPTACAPAVSQLDATVGLPGAFLLDGETLNFDNEEILLDLTRAPTLSWEVLAEGPIDVTSIQLHELLSISNATTVVYRWGAMTVGTTARIEPSMLEVGHTYIFSVVPQRGRPYASTGDYMTIEQPLENASIWTFTFVVREPG